MLRGREFDYEAVAPAVLGNKDRLHSCRELRFTVIAHDTREGVELSVANPDFDLGLRLNVAHPVCALALGNELEAPAMLGEPNLNLTRLSGDAASGHQVKVDRTRLAY